MLQLFSGGVGLLNRALSPAVSGFGFLALKGVFLVPDAAEDFFAVGEVGAVGAKDFKGDGAVVADGLQRANAMDGIDGAGA